mgnify:CR=1 FL=1
MDAFLTWLRQDTAGLLTLAGLGIALLLFLIIKLKVEPFIALVGVGVLVALAGGVSIPDLVGTPIKSSDALIEKGFAGILGHSKTVTTQRYAHLNDDRLRNASNHVADLMRTAAKVGQ